MIRILSNNVKVECCFFPCCITDCFLIDAVRSIWSIVVIIQAYVEVRIEQVRMQLRY